MTSITNKTGLPSVEAIDISGDTLYFVAGYSGIGAMHARESITGSSHWINYIGAIDVSDISAYTQQSDSGFELVDLYIASSGTILKMNMSKPYGSLINIQNNTLKVDKLMNIIMEEATPAIKENILKRLETIEN